MFSYHSQTFVVTSIVSAAIVLRNMSRSFTDPRGDGNSAREKEVSESEEDIPVKASNSSQTLATYRYSSASSRNRNRRDLLRAKDVVWESLANKTLPPEESDHVMRRLEKKADARTPRSYIEGNPTTRIIESAIRLSVGLTFMPGADKAQVARFEQGGLSNSQPDQKNAM